ncbi:hypothetical protein E2C01_056078 [Portunus trituberculatus]|uniref:Uncharacterized protein n=1 Tax=Portunus trituberculatus TaxID=210409 RepID=A0A5B7GWX1_PORTR|nr:hypothetical protein [Portunus trituberculatus]
MSRLALHPV